MAAAGCPLRHRQAPGSKPVRAKRIAELRSLLAQAHASGGLPRWLRERIRIALAKRDAR